VTVQIPDLTPEQLAEAARIHAERVAAAEAAKTAGAPEGEDPATLPEWARKAISRGNDEAARYRTELRAAQDKLRDAKTPEEYQAAIAEWQTRVTETTVSAAREIAKVRFGLPDTLAGRLQGATTEEILADAEALAQSLKPAEGASATGQSAVDVTRLAGGLGGHQQNLEPETYDPAALALEHVKATRGSR